MSDCTHRTRLAHTLFEEDLLVETPAHSCALHRTVEVVAHAAHQYMHTAGFHAQQELLELGECNRIGVAHPLQSQDDHLGVGTHLRLDRVEVAFHRRHRTEKEFSLQTEDQQLAAWYIVGQPFVDAAFGADNELCEQHASGAWHGEHEGHEHADHHAEFDRDRQRGKGGCRDDRRVEVRCPPVEGERAPVDHAPRCDHEYAGQCCTRQVLCVGCKDHHDGRYAGSRDHAGPLGGSPGLLVDGRACQRARTGNALVEAAPEIRERLAEALLVHVELLAGLRCDRLGHRNCFEQSEQGDRERIASKLLYFHGIEYR